MKKFSFSSRVVRYPGPGGWHFASLPRDMSQKVRDSYPARKKVGRAYVKVRAKIGKTSWDTTLFPTKEGPYLLAVKASVRQAESVDADDTVRISCVLL